MAFHLRVSSRAKQADNQVGELANRYERIFNIASPHSPMQAPPSFRSDLKASMESGFDSAVADIKHLINIHNSIGSASQANASAAFLAAGAEDLANDSGKGLYHAITGRVSFWKRSSAEPALYRFDCAAYEAGQLRSKVAHFNSSNGLVNLAQQFGEVSRLGPATVNEQLVTFNATMPAAGDVLAEAANMQKNVVLQRVLADAYRKGRTVEAAEKELDTIMFQLAYDRAAAMRKYGIEIRPQSVSNAQNVQKQSKQKNTQTHSSNGQSKFWNGVKAVGGHVTAFSIFTGGGALVTGGIAYGVSHAIGIAASMPTITGAVVGAVAGTTALLILRRRQP